MTLEDFKKQLAQVDFNYQYIDNDHARYRKEHDKYVNVLMTSKEQPEFQQLFNEAKLFNNNN